MYYSNARRKNKAGFASQAVEQFLMKLTKKFVSHYVCINTKCETVSELSSLMEAKQILSKINC